MMWILFTVLSLLFVFLNLIRCFKGKTKGHLLLAFLSLFSACAVVFDFLHLFKNWVLKEDWAALSDVLPVSSTILTVALTGCFVINLIAVIMHKAVEKRKQKLPKE